MKSERAADLPAPGSPPSSTLRSGSPIETGFPSSSTPRARGSHSDRPGPGQGGTGTESGSLEMIETWASDALAGSRRTRTLRTPMVAASDSEATSTNSALKPAGRRRTNRRPAGIGSLDSTLGSWPRRLITSQATMTRENQRRVARSDSVVASRWRRTGDRHTAMPIEPRRRTPRPWPSRATPICQTNASPRHRATSSPHPRTTSAIRE